MIALFVMKRAPLSYDAKRREERNATMFFGVEYHLVILSMYVYTILSLGNSS